MAGLGGLWRSGCASSLGRGDCRDSSERSRRRFVSDPGSGSRALPGATTAGAAAADTSPGGRTTAAAATRGGSGRQTGVRRGKAHAAAEEASVHQTGGADRETGNSGSNRTGTNRQGRHDFQATDSISFRGEEIEGDWQRCDRRFSWLRWKRERREHGSKHRQCDSGQRSHVGLPKGAF